MAIPTSGGRPSIVKPDDSRIGEFEGIVNAKLAKEIGHKALVSAINMEVDDEKRLSRRDGSAQVLMGAFVGGYATMDQSLCYLVDSGGTLRRFMEDGTTRQLATGLSPGGTYSWAEGAENAVYFVNGAASGIINNDGTEVIPLAIVTPQITDVELLENGTHQLLPFHIGDSYTQNTIRFFVTYTLADGRESPPSQVYTLTAPPEAQLVRVTVAPMYALTNVYVTAPGGSTYFLVGSTPAALATFAIGHVVATGGMEYEESTVLEGLPTDVTLVGYFNGYLYAAEYIPSQKLSVIWRSLALRPHLFDKTSDFALVVGQVQLFLPTNKMLVVGTDNQIYSLRHEADGDMVLTEEADFGVPPGSCGEVEVFADIAYFWTLRGIAKAFPFEVVTEGKFSVDPGVVNHARLFYKRGFTRLVASTIKGNTAFNQRSKT